MNDYEEQVKSIAEYLNANPGEMWSEMRKLIVMAMCEGIELCTRTTPEHALSLVKTSAHLNANKTTVEEVLSEA